MESKKELILLRITGEDRPGLTASFMEILARYDADVMDIGQADIHNTLSLGIMIYVDEANSGQVMKHVLFKASELGVTVHVAPVSEEEYNAWVGRQGKNRSILTVLGRRLEARLIEAVTKIIANQGLNLDSIRRLTGRPPLHEDKDSAKAAGKQEESKLASTPEREQARTKSKACIEFSVRGTPNDKAQLHEQLMRLSSEMEVDFSYQRDDMYRRMRRLICFDMDSTLIQTECIDELAERNGVGKEVRAITESAMRGEIDFKESFTRRVALLKGLDVSVMQDIAEHLPMTEGVERLMMVLKRYGYKIALLSGGFTFFGEYLQKKLGIDYVYANELEIGEDGRLTGRYVGDIVDGHRKAELLRLIAQVEKVDLEQTIAVGDGANDLPMLSLAGLGIAFHAKPRVVANAKQSINTIGIDGVLYFLGFKDSYLHM